MRRSGIFFGVAIIVAGALLLAINLGVLSTSAWNFFWPVIVILLGAWFLMRPTINKDRTVDAVQSNVTLDGASQGEIVFQHEPAACRWMPAHDRVNCSAAPFSGRFNRYSALSRLCKSCARNPHDLISQVPGMQANTVTNGMSGQLRGIA